MARIRTVKPELLTHEELFRAEEQTGLPLRIAFVGLFTQCDREGRFKWRPGTLKLGVLPFDNLDFSRVLDALVTRGFVGKYAFEGEEFGYIPSFTKHQVINNRESMSELPDPMESTLISSTSTRDARVGDALTTRLVQDQGERKGKERKGRGREGDNAPASADAELFPGVDPQVIADFKSIRKQKKAAITLTAMRGIQREAEKAGMSLDDALRVCCVRGWQGFKAEWITRDQSVGARNGMPAPKQSNMEATLAAAERARKLIFGDEGEGSNAAG